MGLVITRKRDDKVIIVHKPTGTFVKIMLVEVRGSTARIDFEDKTKTFLIERDEIVKKRDYDKKDVVYKYLESEKWKRTN